MTEESRGANAPPWAKVKLVLGEALEQPAQGRAAYLDAACAGDLALRAEIEDLLRVSDAGVDSLEPPIGAPSRPPLPAVADAMIGARVGRYRITRLIGYGGMGAVYEAEQEQPRRTVALKVMRPGLASPKSLRRFEFESQMLARLSHPGIAQVFEAGTHDPEPGDPARAVPYFAMEYIPGAAPITEFARARALTVRQRLELFARVCDAVHHGHQHGVIHRDLKPANILVDAKGAAKVIDFGVARALDTGVGATTMTRGAGQIIGTLQYMSPEQCVPDLEGIDTRADVYALGAVLYELLADRLPYHLSVTSLPESVRIIRETSPAPLSAINRALRGDVATIVRAAMEKDKTRRYPSASALGEDIRRYLRAEPIAARAPSAAYQLRVFARRNKALVGGVAAVFMVLVVGIITTGLALRAARTEARRAQRIAAFIKDAITAGNPYLPSGIMATATWWEGPFVARHETELPSGEPGRSFAVPDLVKLAGDRLGSAFPDEPVIRAELADTLGRTLFQLGRSGEGKALLRQAVETREQVLGRDHEDTIRSRLRLAARVEGDGAYAEAEPHLRAALESCRRTFGPADPRTLAVAGRFAENLAWHRPGEVLALARENLAIAVEAHGVDHLASLSQMRFVSGALASAGDLEDAEETARRALAGYRRTAGEDSFETATAKLTLVGILRMRGAFAEAADHLRAGLRVIRLHYADDIVRTLPYEMELVGLLQRMGLSSEGVVEARRVVDAARGAFGAENHNVYKLEALLARVILEAGTGLEEAESLARHAAQGMMRTGGLVDLNTYFCADALHCAIRLLGRPQEAESLARALLHGAQEQRIAEPLLLLPLHLTLGECLMDLGNHAEAEAHLLAAWGQAEDPTAKASDPYNPRRLALIRALVRLYEETDQPERAAEYLARRPPDAAGR